MTSLPFTQQLAKDRRFWRVIGIITVGADGLGVEWRSDEYERKAVTYQLEHVARGELQHVLIPWSVIDAVTYHGRIFGAGQIRIRARTMNALGQLPGAEGPFWWARVAKPERRRAREVALAAEGAIGATTRYLERRAGG